MDDYQKAVQKDLQSQYSRSRNKRELNAPEPLTDPELTAVEPAMPDEATDVLCMICGTKILAQEPGVDAAIKQKERKFRICRNCRGMIVSPGGVLDRSTPGLERDRKLK